MSTNDDLILQGYYKTLDVITAKKIKQNKKKTPSCECDVF